MAVKIKSLASRVSTLALTLAILAAPVAVQAQEDGRHRRDNEAAGDIGNGHEARRAPRAAQNDGNGDAGPRRLRSAPQATPAGDYQQGRAAQAPGWNRSAERREGNGWNGNRSGWESRREQNRVATAPQPQAAPAPVIQGRSWSDGRAVRTEDTRRVDRSGSTWRQDRDRTYRDAARTEDSRWRDRNRQEYRRDADRRDSDRRWDSRGDRSRYGYNQSNRHWDNRWRDNRRYDWYSYRRTYPSTFRIGVYYSPYRNYSYRRLNTGFFLDALFFSNRYWINDPWQYRLPEAYGPYRWIRYYDDALLVDTYTGEVVDAIYSFFW